MLFGEGSEIGEVAMIGVDIQLVSSQFWARLASDAAGASVRAALGAGATSIIHADQLAIEPRPARPLLAGRGGQLTGQSGEMRQLWWRWWVYDDPTQMYWRINGLLPLIEQAYPLHALPHGEIRVGIVTDERPDTTLKLLTRSIQLIYTTRG